MLFCNHSVGNAWGRQDPKVGLETPSSSSALDLAPKGSLRKVTWRFPFTWTHPPRSKLLAVAEVFSWDLEWQCLGRQNTKGISGPAELFCACSAAGRSDELPFLSPMDWVFLQLPVLVLGVSARVIRVPCVLRERGWSSPAQNGAVHVQFPGPALPVPAWRYEVQEGSCPCWEQPGGQDGSSVLETTPWLCPEAACSDQAWADHNKFRCLRDRSRDCAWVPLSWVPVCWGCGLGGSCCLE